MQKIHNRLRTKLDFYHNWHNYKYSSHIHFFILIIFLAIIFMIIFLKFEGLIGKKNNNKISASENSKALTAQADWQAGTYDMGADLINAPGDMKLFDEAEVDPSVGSWTTDGAGSLSSLYDGNTVTGISLAGGNYILRDFGQTVSNITKYRIYFTGGPGGTVFPGLCGKPKTPLAFSCGDLDGDGIEWLNYATFGNTNMEPGVWNDKLIGPSGHSKLRLVADESYTITEYEFYFQPLTATHTTASTQIGDVSADPGRYVVQYQGFDATETEPANTTIDYRVQLVNSSGASTSGWTAWASGDVADLTTTYPSQLTLTQTKLDAGETYLQVQSKLTSTDGVSTPTLSDYTVNYHTNKAPSAPSAL
ncbi:MAG: hypothetical protein CEN89_51, partial [Candidatus Berkelbacteria bacterium Licking1014_7]